MSILLFSFTVLAWFEAPRDLCLTFIATDIVDTIGVFIRSEFYIPNSSDVFATKAKDNY
jgi:hypothetical protein